MIDSLTDISNKLTELEDRSTRSNIQIDGIAEEPRETREECERKVQRLLSEELDISDAVTERAHRAKAYSHKKKSSKKLKSRKLFVNCSLLLTKQEF